MIFAKRFSTCCASGVSQDGIDFGGVVGWYSLPYLDIPAIKGHSVTSSLFDYSHIDNNKRSQFETGTWVVIQEVGDKCPHLQSYPS